MKSGKKKKVFPENFSKFMDAIGANRKSDKTVELVEGTKDCFVVRNFLDDDLNVCTDLEKQLENASGKPKAVFQATSPEEDSFFYLRCPSIKPEDLTNFSPIVEKVNQSLCQLFPDVPVCNIAKIVKYGDGSAHELKSHADKIIDLAPGSNIYTVRFGNEKSMVLTHKESGEKIVIKLPHNTLLVIGWITNKNFTHGVPADRTGEGPTYSVVLRTSVTVLHKPSLTLRGDRVGKSNLPHANKELIDLWAQENMTIIADSHYDEYCRK